MRRTFLTISLLLTVICFAVSQNLSTTDAVLVYYMPKNVLAFDVEYTEIVSTKGPFYQYAERYLGTKDVVMADDTHYELKQISLHTKTVADKSRSFTFTPSKNQRANLIFDKKGLLAAYNAELPKDKAKSDIKYTNSTNPVSEKVSLAPFSEEALLATSKAKMAESTAKQIYHIREARINLLAGDVDHMPTESKALSLILKQLDEEEEALVKLFIGTTQKHRKHKIIYLEPESDENGKVLLRFSEFAGPLAVDKQDGEPILLTMSVFKHELQESVDKRPEPRSDIYYNLPGEVAVTLSDAEGKELLKQTVPIAQFGVAVALPQSLISRKPHIIFNTRTGAIQSISE